MCNSSSFLIKHHKWHVPHLNKRHVHKWRLCTSICFWQVFSNTCLCICVDQNVHSPTTLFMVSMINAHYTCVFTCTGMFHTAAEYAACNYLRMRHSIRQSCDPWWLLDSPENSPRRSHTAFRLNFQLTSVAQRIMAAFMTIHRHTHTHIYSHIRAFTKTHKHMHIKTQ